MKTKLALISLIALLMSIFPAGGTFMIGKAATVETVPEGRDFATQVLRDPWDMNEYSDVSYFINGDGEVINLDNISTSNGIFSAHSTVADNWFYLLFAGYESALMVGKIGHNYPIVSSDFHCFSIAMNANQSGTQKMSVWWADDDHLSSGQWGVSGWSDVVPYWKLYQIDLATSYAGSPTDPNSTRWGDRSTWQNLYVRPFLQANINFSVDWARLTDCQPVYKTINWSGSGPVSIYLQPSGTTRQIQVATGITNHAYDLDVQGVAPGEYTYLVKNGSTTLASGTFAINAAPIAHFTRPSFTSGEDFATSTGNPWDMDSSADIDSIDCASGSFINGLLKLVTPGPLQQANPDCRENNISDSRIWLPFTMPVDTSQYRYLTFRMNTEGGWADVSNAMVIRWVWAINNDACGVVSNDIPFNVGWETTSIDLGDPQFGVAEDWTGACPPSPIYWSNYPAKRVRFDPNENTLADPMTQWIDYIYLTKMDRTRVDSYFPVQVSLNKPDTGISTTYYYTSTLSDPTQHTATAYTNTFHSSGAFYIYLPILTKGSILQNPISFIWDTHGVSAGTYYLCARFNDGLNSTLYCSDAPVSVTP